MSSVEGVSRTRLVNLVYVEITENPVGIPKFISVI